jgi:hypothetical protein
MKLSKASPNLLHFQIWEEKEMTCLKDFIACAFGSYAAPERSL